MIINLPKEIVSRNQCYTSGYDRTHNLLARIFAIIIKDIKEKIKTYKLKNLKFLSPNAQLGSGSGQISYKSASRIRISNSNVLYGSVRNNNGSFGTLH
jgi:hypothetical protein